MTRKTVLSYFGAVLLLIAAPPVYAAPGPAPAQTTTKKKTTSSKSKRKPKPVSQKAPASDRIREIQTSLQKEGAYQGDPSGKWDDSTVEAMKAFQDKNGLTPTGKIDALTLEKLGLGSETAGKGAPIPTASTVKPPPDSMQ
jgi:peptidoglycan hydrolase-like protein with peptidoglycan-binding domain